MTEDRDLVSRLLADHELGAELGRGQFGVVWAARHRRLNRQVAVKQLSGPIAANEEHASRFRREARILASLDHPHVVTVYDYREEGDLHLLIMELLPGGTLKGRAGTGGVDSVIAGVLAACCGLHHVHLQGVLHRDVKPENLMFDRRGALKVTDFGLARGDTSRETGMQITRAGDFFGTPAYVAPEQVEGALGGVPAPVGPGADQYSVAALLYESLSGRLTHDGSGGIISLCHRRMSQDPDPLSAVAPHVAAPVADVVIRAVQRDPAERYPSVEEFGMALGQAAHATFGDGWLDRADVELRDAGPIRTYAEGRGGVVVATARPGSSAGADPNATVAVGPPGAPAPPAAPPTWPGPVPGPGSEGAGEPKTGSSRKRWSLVGAGVVALVVAAVAVALLTTGTDGSRGTAAVGGPTSGAGRAPRPVAASNWPSTRPGPSPPAVTCSPPRRSPQIWSWSGARTARSTASSRPPAGSSGRRPPVARSARARSSTGVRRTWAATTATCTRSTRQRVR